MWSKINSGNYMNCIEIEGRKSGIEEKLTKLLVFLKSFLLTDLETLGLGGSEIVIVVVGHCDYRLLF